MSTQDLLISEINILPVIRGYLDQITTGMISTLNVRAGLVYLTKPILDLFTPFLSAGKLSDTELSLFENQSLDPTNDLLAFDIWERRRPIQSYRGISGRRITPSILSSLDWNTTLSIPILDQTRSSTQEALLGLIVLCKEDQDEEFSENQVLLAQTFATTIAISLENAHLYNELHRHLEENQSLHQINSALLQKLDLGEVLSIVCDEARRLTGSAGSSVALLEDKEWLRIACSSGQTYQLNEKLSINDSIFGIAVRRGEPVLINNRFHAPASLLALPLETDSGIIGVLDVVNSERGFTVSDVDLITRFADQASVAIEHARLYQQSEDLAVENERQRLARELHDSVSQSLYAISMYSEAARRQIKRGNTDKAVAYLTQLIDTSASAQGQMRRLIFGLHPVQLHDQGLVETLRERIRSVEDRAGLQVAFHAEITCKLSDEVESELYGIAQEALNNILKHSFARQVSVDLAQVDDVVILKITDDGIGFDPEKVNKSGGMGLKNMRERAALIGATLKFVSNLNGGTTIYVEVRV